LVTLSPSPSCSGTTAWAKAPRSSSRHGQERSAGRSRLRYHCFSGQP
jgi:hypothetical protein